MTTLKIKDLHVEVDGKEILKTGGGFVWKSALIEPNKQALSYARFTNQLNDFFCHKAYQIRT